MKNEKHEIKLEAIQTKNIKIEPRKKEGSIKEVLGIDNSTVDDMYSRAYLFYNTGRYKDAAQIFKILITLHSNEFKYTMGLAACHHMLKEYEMAAGEYLVVSSIDPLNPIPFFHASDCYIQIGDKASAALMLEMALKRVNDKKEFVTLKQRAEITLAGLKKELLPKS